MTSSGLGDQDLTSAPIIGQKVLRPRQQVEEALKKAVLSGQVATGERLPSETELARQFSVSRPTIREALSALESHGLIRKVPGMGGGSIVQAIDYKALGQVVQQSMHNLLKLGTVNFDEVGMVRQYLEIPSVALAAVARTEDDVAELRSIVDAQKSLPISDPRVSELDAEFHTAIARMSGNRVLASLVYALHRESEPVSYLDLSPEVGRETVLQHQKIVRAIADRDPAAAEEAITVHLTYLRQHTNAAVAELDGAPR